MGPSLKTGFEHLGDTLLTNLDIRTINLERKFILLIQLEILIHWPCFREEFLTSTKLFMLIIKILRSWKNIFQTNEIKIEKNTKY